MDPDIAGALKVIDEFVICVMVATAPPMLTVVPPGTRFKLAPVSVTGVPGFTTAGVNPLTLGLRMVTVRGDEAVAVPTVTLTRPVLAPIGTVTVRLLAEAATTVAATPPMVT